MSKTTSSIDRLSRFQAKQTRRSDPSLEADRSAIDWDELHQKIVTANAKNAWVEELPADQLTEAWARRASQLARAIESADQGEQVELAIVRLGREIYGLDVRYVYDIRPLAHLTRVPRTPAWVAGVVNLRGRIISVLDLQRFLGLPDGNAGEPQAATRHLVLVETPEMELAIVVDEVLSMETLPVQKIQEATSAVRGIRLEYLRGLVVRDQITEETQAAAPNTASAAAQHHSGGSSMLVILDLPVLLADKQLLVHEEVI